jgi:hypothetical protein
MAQHLGGRSMAELTGSCSGRIDASTQECMTNDRSNGGWTQKAVDRSSGPQKHAPTATWRSSASEIRDNRFADLGAERQLESSAALAAHA